MHVLTFFLHIVTYYSSKVAAFLTDKENKFQSKLTIECSATQCRLLVPQLETRWGVLYLMELLVFCFQLVLCIFNLDTIRFSGATVTSTEKVSHFEVLVQKQGPLSAEASDKHDLFPEKNEIHENVGFSHVIRKISNSVTHFCSIPKSSSKNLSFCIFRRNLLLGIIWCWTCVISLISFVSLCQKSMKISKIWSTQFSPSKSLINQGP